MTVLNSDKSQNLAFVKGKKRKKKKILYTYAEHRHDSKNTRHVRAHNIFMSFDDQLLFFKTKRTAV